MLILICGRTATLQGSEPGKSASDDAGSMVRADIRLDQATLLVGQKIWATFTITNLLSDAVGLQVPGAQVAEMPTTEVGLPLQHVFSGKNFAALTIDDDERGTMLGEAITLKPVAPVPPVTLAAHACVGLRIELTQYYDLLQRPGAYKLIWKPYQGSVQSEPVPVTVLAKQRAKIITDFGPINIEFLYDVAPNHIRNFVELAKASFYDNLTFHRVIPGGIIQGGDPKGDGLGGRPDGKTVKAEFSKVLFEPGIVGMARSRQNPDSASSQFFICLSAQPSFVGKQTAFAKVVGQESFETLKKIAALPTGPKDRPLQTVYIRTISLENIPERPQEHSPLAGGDEAKPGVAVVRLPGNGQGSNPPVENPGPVGSRPADSQPATGTGQ
jgi:peptidyl-prolyl cis-trans isomerase B (cyclophilin B)